MPRSRVDHLVLTVPSLGAGVDYVRQTLGVSPRSGCQRALKPSHLGARENQPF